jgi:hypothetical protein
MFTPYREIKEPNAEVRAALRDLLVRAKKRAEPTFIFVNNRLEGFAPGTIAAIVEGILSEGVKSIGQSKIRPCAL